MIARSLDISDISSFFCSVKGIYLVYSLLFVVLSLFMICLLWLREKMCEGGGGGFCNRYVRTVGTNLRVCPICNGVYHFAVQNFGINTPAGGENFPYSG